jgi:predicted DNA-binding transcriptional regulator AlpA
MDDDQCMAKHPTTAEPLWVKVRPEWIEKELARRSCLDMLMSRFELGAALVSVPQLGKVLGMSKSTIYASVKAGTFFIPHRLIGASPVFTIDDVVTWYLAGSDQAQSKPEAPREVSGASDRRNADDGIDSLHARDKQSRDRAVDAMVARALKSMSQGKSANG